LEWMLPLTPLLLVYWQRYFQGIVGCIAVKSWWI